MPSRVLSLTAPLVAVFAFAACSSDSSMTAPPSSSSEATTSTSTTTSTTVAPTVTTDPIVPASSASAAAGKFVTAWRNADQAAASAIAAPAAVQTVFAAGKPGKVEDRGCNTPPINGPVLCVYRTAAGELQVRVQPRPDGWFVDQAIVSPA
jgi:hypothetical protein